jgi:hypothetical protein
MSDDSESEMDEGVDKEAKIARLLKGEKLQQQEDDSDSDDEE